MFLRALVFSVCAVMSLQGCNCGDNGSPPDSGSPVDAGSDAGTDAGTDAGQRVEDAGVDAGERALEAAVTGDMGDILLVRLDGGAEVYAPANTSSERINTWPRWHPDGTRLAFTDSSSVFIREADGGVTAIPVGGDYRGGSNRVEWSPDGTRLAFDGFDARRGSSVFLLPLDGGAPEVIGRASEWTWLGNDALVLSDFFGEAFVSWRYSLSTRLSESLEVPEFVIGATSDARMVVARTEPLADGGTLWQLYTVELDGGSAPLFPGRGIEGSQSALAVLSPFALEAAVLAADDDTGKGRLLWVTASGVSTVLELGVDAPAPRCLRFVRGTQDLSFLRDLPSPQLLVATRDGGIVTRTPSDLSLGDSQGCLDWRLAP